MGLCLRLRQNTNAAIRDTWRIFNSRLLITASLTAKQAPNSCLESATHSHETAVLQAAPIAQLRIPRETGLLLFIC